MRLRIGILGTRGIPNQYGGFEQFASCLSRGLVEKGHEVSVYNSHNHPYQENTWFGVNLIHCFDPEYLIGTAGQFIYDLNCIHDAQKRNFDILLVLGYTSSSVWGRYYPSKSIVITNMDGLEWKRSKYPKLVKQFLKYAEKLAVKYSNFHIADSIPVQQYLIGKYHIDPVFISYGADLTYQIDDAFSDSYGVVRGEYFLLITRMEPENNIQMILDGLCAAGQDRKVLVISGTANGYGKKMIARYASNAHILFPGAIYDTAVVNSLRLGCRAYFHGHSVGGTNPSLLEAMAAGAFIFSHNNEFNRAVLGEDALYFSSSKEVAELVEKLNEYPAEVMKANNLEKIKNDHSWRKIISEYEQQFILAFQNKK